MRLLLSIYVQLQLLPGILFIKSLFDEIGIRIGELHKCGRMDGLFWKIFFYSFTKMYLYVNM